MKPLQIVLDTNVLVSALRSKRGASHRLLRLIDSGRFELNLSVPLVLEYEQATKRLIGETALSEENIDDLIDYIVARANRHEIHYLWRPLSSDPKDDMILELAVAAGCNAIVTFNRRDFLEARRFGIRILSPGAVLQEIGELP